MSREHETFTKIQAAMVKDILGQMSAADWEEELTRAYDVLVAYFMQDEQFAHNQEDADTLYYLRHLRQCFKNLKQLQAN